MASKKKKTEGHEQMPMTKNVMRTPHQGKDTVYKYLSNIFKDKSFAAYGLKNFPAIKAFLPTDFPTVEANYRIADHVFLLEDDSYAIVDYESSFKNENKLKYLDYATRTYKRYFKPGQPIKIRIIVIYTCSVKSADSSIRAGSLNLDVEEVFMTHINGDAEFERIKAKFMNNEDLTDEDLMKLIVLPITQMKNDDISGMIDNVIDFAEEMKNVDIGNCAFVLSAMSVAMRNYITEEQKRRIWEVLTTMTSIIQDLVQELDRKIAEEKQQQRQAGRAEGITVGIDQANERVARDMLLEKGHPFTIPMIAKISKLSEDVIRGIAKSLGLDGLDFAVK